MILIDALHVAALAARHGAKRSIGTVGCGEGVGIAVDGTVSADQVGSLGVQKNLTAGGNIGAVTAGAAGEDIAALNVDHAAGSGIDGVYGAENLGIVHGQGRGALVDDGACGSGCIAAVYMDGGTHAEEVACLRGTLACGVAVGGESVQGQIAALLDENGGSVGMVVGDGVLRRNVLGINFLVEIGAVQTHHALSRAGGDVLIVVVEPHQVVILTVDQLILLVNAVDGLCFGEVFRLIGDLISLHHLIGFAVCGIVHAGGNAHGVEILGSGAGGNAHIVVYVIGQLCTVGHSLFIDFGRVIVEALVHLVGIPAVLGVRFIGNVHGSGSGGEGIGKIIGVLSGGIGNGLTVYRQRFNLVLIVRNDVEGYGVLAVQHAGGQMIGAVGLNVALFAAGDGEHSAAVCVIGDEITGGIGGGIRLRSAAGLAVKCAGAAEEGRRI